MAPANRGLYPAPAAGVAVAGCGGSWAVAMWATMIIGMSVGASLASRSDGSSTDTIGSRSIATVIAPIPVPTPMITGRPGTWESAIPPAAPRKSAGKTGPPRKLVRDSQPLGNGPAGEEED